MRTSEVEGCNKITIKDGVSPDLFQEHFCRKDGVLPAPEISGRPFFWLSVIRILAIGLRACGWVSAALPLLGDGTASPAASLLASEAAALGAYVAVITKGST